MDDDKRNRKSLNRSGIEKWMTCCALVIFNSFKVSSVHRRMPSFDSQYFSMLRVVRDPASKKHDLETRNGIWDLTDLRLDLLVLGSMDTTFMCAISLAIMTFDRSFASAVLLHTINVRWFWMGSIFKCSANKFKIIQRHEADCRRSEHSPCTNSIFCASKLHSTWILMLPYRAASRKLPINSNGFSIRSRIRFSAGCQVRAVTTTWVFSSSLSLLSWQNLLKIVANRSSPYRLMTISTLSKTKNSNFCTWNTSAWDFIKLSKHGVVVINMLQPLNNLACMNGREIRWILIRSVISIGRCLSTDRNVPNISRTDRLHHLTIDAIHQPTTQCGCAFDSRCIRTQNDGLRSHRQLRFIECADRRIRMHLQTRTQCRQIGNRFATISRIDQNQWIVTHQVGPETISDNFIYSKDESWWQWILTRHMLAIYRSQNTDSSSDDVSLAWNILHQFCWPVWCEGLRCALKSDSIRY